MKKRIIIGVIAICFVLAIFGIITLLSPTWSTISFEAIIKRNSNDLSDIKTIEVEKTTKIYGDPMCELEINKDTKILDQKNNTIPISDIQVDDKVTVRLKDSFIERSPAYYPIVYSIRLNSR